MTASTVNTTLVANMITNPVVLTPTNKHGGLKTKVETIEVATTSIDETGDIINFFAVPSNAKIVELAHINDDLDSNGSPALTVDWGVAYSGIGGIQPSSSSYAFGTVIDADEFAAANTGLQAATTSWTSVRFKTADHANANKELWDHLGLSSDPGGYLLIRATVVTAAATAAAGTLTARIDYY